MSTIQLFTLSEFLGFILTTVVFAVVLAWGMRSPRKRRAGR